MLYSITKKIMHYLIEPSSILIKLDSYGPFHMKDLHFLRIQYKNALKKNPNLESPQTFNEKLQWLKLHDRNPKYTKMVDKYLVKEYIKDVIGDKYIIPTLGVYDSFDKINFANLPNQFVIKCTHDSGGLVICKNKEKLDKKGTKRKINKSLKRNYYYAGREWPYKNVKPRIIVEPLISDGINDDLTDYKFMCFNGKVHYIFTCTERFNNDGLKVTFFDTNWNVMPFERHYPKSKKLIKQPSNLRKMIELSEKLSKDIPFVRIDFYEVNNKIKFGEITFYPGNGMEEFTPEIWDKKLGDLIVLPKKETNEKQK